MLGAVPAFLAYPNFKVEAAKYRAGLRGVSENLRAKVVVIDSEFPNEMLEHIAIGEESKLLRAGKSKLGTAEFQAFQSSPEAIAFIQHSAGTTGLQKGVALTHRAVLRQIEHLAAVLAIDSRTDRIYSWLPLYHDMGLIACFILPMVCHVPLVMQSPLEWVMRPESMLQIFTQHRCTLAWMPNFAFQFVARRTPASHRADYDLSSARALINCSEPVRLSTMREFEDTFAPIGLNKGVLRSSYAMAENVFAVTQSSSSPTHIRADKSRFRATHTVHLASDGDQGAISFVSSGRLLPNAAVRIVDDSGADLSQGNAGEILIKTDTLFTGYFNRPDLTADAIDGGWYRTGDLGFMLHDELYVVGRKKDLLIVGGENLYPQDIEEIVTAHPAIHDGRAIAMGLYNPELGTEDIVVVAEVEREDVLEDPTQIEQEVRNLIVAGTGVAARRVYLKPPMWIVKSTAGKPARSATREKLLGEHPELNGEERA